MTRLAVFDQREGEPCKPMIQYFRKDYIAKELLKSVVTGTVAFFLLLLMWGIYGAENLLEQINGLDIRQVLVTWVLRYAVFLGVYLLVTYAVYNVRYSRGRQKVKRYYLHLKKVNRLYRQEEEN
jgi:hypothetical protein